MAARKVYEIRRFGADPEHPYDTVGRLADNADALSAEVRELAARYCRGYPYPSHSAHA